jgi:hypothetical protein
MGGDQRTLDHGLAVAGLEVFDPQFMTHGQCPVTVKKACVFAGNATQGKGCRTLNRHLWPSCLHYARRVTLRVSLHRQRELLSCRASFFPFVLQRLPFRLCWRGRLRVRSTSREYGVLGAGVGHGLMGKRIFPYTESMVIR